MLDGLEELPYDGDTALPEDVLDAFLDELEIYKEAVIYPNCGYPFLDIPKNREMLLKYAEGIELDIKRLKEHYGIEKIAIE